MTEIPILFQNKEDCCGCGACLNICPKQAISMEEDECGFIYPSIDEKKCIRCGKCKKVCAFQNTIEENSPVDCYAAISRNQEQRKLSASAGIFAAIATSFLEQGGIVFGAAFMDDWSVHHIRVNRKEDLIKLQGSKYVQSFTDNTFTEVKELLDEGKKVLYSGTPCQIAGLKSYLGREYDNLLTIDIVCHGVPSCKMLKDYLNTFGNKHGGKVEKFTFRDKSIGWGINGSAMIKNKKIKIWQSASSYLFYFTKGWIYRENCYKCKYASMHRPADITLGDYWGIEKQHPKLLKEKEWNSCGGISCLIVNTQKGAKIIESVKDRIKISTTNFEKISKNNKQLRIPSSKGNRDDIIKEYKVNGWRKIEKIFDNMVGIKKYSSFIKFLIPNRLRRLLKKHL